MLTGFSASSDTFSRRALRFAIVGASKGIAEAIVAAAALKVFLIPVLEKMYIESDTGQTSKDQEPSAHVSRKSGTKLLMPTILSLATAKVNCTM